jgi:hypothetical protein
MRVPDSNVAELREHGFTVVPGFLDAKVLEATRAAFWNVFPEPSTYFANPAAYPQLASSPFAGNWPFPFPDWDLNRVCFHPDLIDFVERFLQTTDVELYKSEIWAKYSGAADYDQIMHRDYANHTLVVPQADVHDPQMTTFLLLSDVTEQDAPTKILPVEKTLDVPLSEGILPNDSYDKHEISVVGPAGTLMAYRTDVFHRGSNFTAPGRSRFVVMTDFQRRGFPWRGKMSWPDKATNGGMAEALTRMTPRERDLFGWPCIGDPYWTAQTLTDVQGRYPNMDLAPYRAAVTQPAA